MKLTLPTLSNIFSLSPITKEISMGTITATAPTSFFAGLEAAEIALLKGPIVADLTALTQPNVTFLTALDTIKNIQLQALMLGLPAQTALVNYVASWLLAKINSTPAT